MRAVRYRAKGSREAHPSMKCDNTLRFHPCVFFLSHRESDECSRSCRPAIPRWCGQALPIRPGTRPILLCRGRTVAESFYCPDECTVGAGCLVLATLHSGHLCIHGYSLHQSSFRHVCPACPSWRYYPNVPVLWVGLSSNLLRPGGSWENCSRLFRLSPIP